MKEQELLDKIRCCYLNVIDLSILIDLDPNNKELILKLAETNVRLKMLSELYEQNFHMLSNTNVNMDMPSDYVIHAWPWEVQHVDL